MESFEQMGLKWKNQPEFEKILFLFNKKMDLNKTDLITLINSGKEEEAFREAMELFFTLELKITNWNVFSQKSKIEEIMLLPEEIRERASLYYTNIRDEFVFILDGSGWTIKKEILMSKEFRKKTDVLMPGYEMKRIFDQESADNEAELFYLKYLQEKGKKLKENGINELFFEQAIIILKNKLIEKGE